MVLAENLRALMAATPLCNSEAQLSRRTKYISTRQINRILKMEITTSVDNLVHLAAAFYLEPWQLLVDHLDPNNLPTISALGTKELAIFQMLKEKIEELKTTEAPENTTTLSSANVKTSLANRPVKTKPY